MGGTHLALTPLTITRDPVAYTSWWEQLPGTTRDEITEIMKSFDAGTGDVHDLGWAVSMAFDEYPSGGPGWLTVTGLAATAEITWIRLDIDPAHDGEGILCGAEIVATLATKTAGAAANLRVRAYTDRPTRDLGPTAGAGTGEQLAEVIDAALAWVNQKIEDRDRFIAAAREFMAVGV